MNILNEEVLWFEYDESTTLKDIKSKIQPGQLELDPQDDVPNMIMLLFKGVALIDSDVIIKKLQPGDILDLQFKLSNNREAEFVTYDKQLALDMMFVLYSS